MSNAGTSYRQILKSTSIVGGATVASLVFGLARSKAIALIAGPAGIGLFGVLNTLFNTGTAIAGLNLWASGVRQVGATASGSPERARAETALWLFAWTAAITGGFAFWLFEHFYYMPNTPALAGAPAIPWVALAVMLTTLNSAQLIVLQVNSQIGAIASIRLLGSLFSAILAIVAVFLLGTHGLYLAILAVPVCSIAVTFFYARRHPGSRWQKAGRWVFAEWHTLIVMGFGLTVANLTSNVGQLVLRSMITAKGGLAAAGLFQAAWTLSNVNLTVVLSAMVVDYYPRLTAKARSPKDLSEIMNQQLHVGLLLLGPILTLAIGLAPFAVTLLYSNSFINAAPVLQWQVAGDVLKVAAWSLGFVLLALNATAGYVLVGLAFDAGIVVAVWLLYPWLGLQSAGVGYVVAQAAALLLSVALVGRHGVRIDRRNATWLTALAIGLAILAVVARWSVTAGVAASVAACALTLVMFWREARRMDLPLPARLRRVLRLNAIS